MKRYLVFLIMATILFLAVPGWAQEEANSSGLKTSSGIITTDAAKLTGALIITDGTHDGTLIVYSTLSDAGQVLFKGTVKGAAMFGGATWEIPIVDSNGAGGLYATISGTGANYIIYFK